MSDKTEEPTPKRLRKAREEGDSGASAFAAQSVAFLAVVVLIPGVAHAVASRAADDLRSALSRAAARPVVASVDGAALAQELIALVAPLLLAAAVTAAAVQLVQTGGAMATKRIALDVSRLNPWTGLAQLFSRTRLFSVARALTGGAVVAYLAYRALRSRAADLAHTSGSVIHSALAASTLAHDLARDAALAALALALLDIVVVRQSWRKRLRMSKEEIVREQKESEGDPQIKQARQRAHRELVAAATIASVREATVVIVNPTHIACALRYDEKGGDEAPVLVASGEGELAARIVRAAHDWGVPVVRDVPLARALVELEVGGEIPEALYEAVAEILREVWSDEARAAR